MDRKYWEKIAPDYDAEIFDVLANDKKGISALLSINLPAPKRRSSISVAPLANGFLSLPRFTGRVYAIDISSKNLAIAKKRFAGLRNVGLKGSI